MSTSLLIDEWRMALWVVAKVGGPLVLAALCIGLLISVFQAATQLQENVLSFAPKLVGIGLVLALAGQWLLGELGRYTERTASAIVEVGRNAGRK